MAQRQRKQSQQATDQTTTEATKEHTENTTAPKKDEATEASPNAVVGNLGTPDTPAQGRKQHYELRPGVYVEDY